MVFASDPDFAPVLLPQVTVYVSEPAAVAAGAVISPEAVRPVAPSSAILQVVGSASIDEDCHEITGRCPPAVTVEGLTEAVTLIEGAEYPLGTFLQSIPALGL